MEAKQFNKEHALKIGKAKFIETHQHLLEDEPGLDLAGMWDQLSGKAKKAETAEDKVK